MCAFVYQLFVVAPTFAAGKAILAQVDLIRYGISSFLNFKRMGISIFFLYVCEFIGAYDGNLKNSRTLRTSSP